MTKNFHSSISKEDFESLITALKRFYFSDNGNDITAMDWYSFKDQLESIDKKYENAIFPHVHSAPRILFEPANIISDRIESYKTYETTRNKKFHLSRVQTIVNKYEWVFQIVPLAAAEIPFLGIELTPILERALSDLDLSLEMDLSKYKDELNRFTCSTKLKIDYISYKEFRDRTSGSDSTYCFSFKEPLDLIAEYRFQRWNLSYSGVFADGCNIEDLTKNFEQAYFTSWLINRSKIEKHPLKEIKHYALKAGPGMKEPEFINKIIWTSTP